MTALHQAAYNSQIDTIKALLENSARTTIFEDQKYDTPLHTAITASNPDAFAELLLAKDAVKSLETKNGQNETPLEYAFRLKNTRVRLKL